MEAMPMQEKKGAEEEKACVISSSNGLIHKPLSAIALPKPAVNLAPRPVSELEAAAIKLQKVYKSYRTRRNLADCAVVVEELWWKAVDLATLERSSISFFDCEKKETAISKWARARTRVAKVGKGLFKYERAQKLALQHWLEAIDPRHRYGQSLHLYYDVWFESESTQPFFYWLDVGNGKELNLESCPRSELQSQCIQYLGPKEREAYEVIVEEGKLVYKQSRKLKYRFDNDTDKFVICNGYDEATPEKTEDSSTDNVVDLDKQDHQESKAEEEVKQEVEVFNMDKPLSCKWTTGTGPRIGCVRDYPVDLQNQALKRVKLSPRLTDGATVSYGPIPSPRPSPKVRVSPRLAYMGIPSPRPSNTRV